jgi:hypothetical protein
MRKRLFIASVALLVVSNVGVFFWPDVNASVFDKYAAYGEVPIPGTRTLHLPDGHMAVGPSPDGSKAKWIMMLPNSCGAARLVGFAASRA